MRNRKGDLNSWSLFQKRNLFLLVRMRACTLADLSYLTFSRHTLLNLGEKVNKVDHLSAIKLSTSSPVCNCITQGHMEICPVSRPAHCITCHASIINNSRKLLMNSAEHSVQKAKLVRSDFT